MKGKKTGYFSVSIKISNRAGESPKRAASPEKGFVTSWHGIFCHGVRSRPEKFTEFIVFVELQHVLYHGASRPNG
jgi:hypothetical protein